MISLEIVHELDRARREHRPIDPPAGLSGLALGAAYDMQDRLVALREGAGEQRTGWKLGITSTVKQRSMGIETPVYGRTFGEAAFVSNASVARDGFIAPRCEPEIAFGLLGALDPLADRAGLLEMVAWLAPALEITDSRYASGTRTAVELIADNTSGGGYVVGTWIDRAGVPDLTTMTTTLARNGETLARGSTGDVLGDPVHALALLATHLAARGLSTRAGDIVLSGAITEAFPVAAGDIVEARITGLGDVRVAFV